MDANRLRILRELGDRGSLTAVAQALEVTPSAVSQQLALLQAETDIPLTELAGRRLVLTKAGEALAHAGIAVARALTDAEVAMADFLNDAHSPVSVCAFNSAGVTFFPAMLELSGSNGPTFRFADEDVAQSDFVKLTADYDLVIAHRLPHQPKWHDDRIVVVPLLTEPLNIAMSTSHPLATLREISGSDLQGQKWVSVHDGYPLRGVLEQISSFVGEPALIEHEINDFMMVASIVGRGNNIAILPKFTAYSLLGDRVVLKNFSGARLIRQVDILTRPENLRRLNVTQAIKLLRAVAVKSMSTS